MSKANTRMVGRIKRLPVPGVARQIGSESPGLKILVDSPTCDGLIHPTTLIRTAQGRKIRVDENRQFRRIPLPEARLRIRE